MELERFIKSREPFWKRMEHVVETAEGKTPGGWDLQEARQFGSLYRDLVSDLSYAQSYYRSPDLHAYLHRLAGRAYTQLYPVPSFTWRGLVDFFWSGFPALVRRTLAYTALSAALFVGTGVVGAWWTYRSPHLIESMQPYVERARQAEREDMVWASIPAEARPYVSTFLMTNNITVMLLACFTGLVGGLGTAYYIGQNGFFFGHVLAACHLLGVLPALMAFVIAHGVLEFSSIFLAGGAGLLMGDALWRPGPFTRLEVLRAHGRSAVLLIAGTLPLMALAGIVESFFSPLALPWTVKWSVALLLAVGLAAYLSRGWVKSSGVASSRDSA